MRGLLTLVFVCSLAACKKDATGSNDPYSMAGSWQGSNQGTNMAMDLTDKPGGYVNGTGQITGFGGGVVVDVDGTRNGQGFMLTISHPGYQSAQYAGAVRNDSTLDGQLNGSGFAGLTMVLHRN